MPDGRETLSSEYIGIMVSYTHCLLFCLVLRLQEINSHAGPDSMTRGNQRDRDRERAANRNAGQVWRVGPCVMFY